MAMTPDPRSRALLFDVTRCVGCRSCATACKESHGFPGTGEETELDAVTYTVVLDKGEDRYVRRMCMHCADASCASACPVGAFTKTKLGPVVYDGSKCLGCRYCMIACPFSVPRYEWSKVAPLVRKCDGCFERQAAGKPNACAEACGFEASPVPFDQLGLAVGLGTDPLPNLTWAALSKIPGVVGLGCVGLSAIYWITHRRQEVAAAERREEENEHAAH
jgi:formate dehydrogenase iron-sulfur subunit